MSGEEDRELEGRMEAKSSDPDEVWEAGIELRRLEVLIVASGNGRSVGEAQEV